MKAMAINRIIRNWLASGKGRTWDELDAWAEAIVKGLSGDEIVSRCIDWDDRGGFSGHCLAKDGFPESDQSELAKAREMIIEKAIFCNKVKYCNGFWYAFDEKEKLYFTWQLGRYEVLE